MGGGVLFKGTRSINGCGYVIFLSSVTKMKFCILSFLGGIRSPKMLFCELEYDYVEPKVSAILPQLKRSFDVIGCIGLTTRSKIWRKRSSTCLAPQNVSFGGEKHFFFSFLHKSKSHHLHKHLSNYECRQKCIWKFRSSCTFNELGLCFG